jgi:ParB family transcriptional regulator, chromosome partitioning protein
MTPQHIELIPIAQVRIVNPRSRNRHTFHGIISNIRLIGLKKPITVYRRQAEADGTQSDLVCGQGRLEALAASGSTTIPAIVTTASLRERYLMSLVENVARKRPPQSNLLREVRGLKERGYKNTAIAAKLGMGKTYVDGIMRLLRCGEDRLIEQVAAGRVPLSVAIHIATSDNTDIQRALSDAYDNGELRGAKLLAVQRLIAGRTDKLGSDCSILRNAKPTAKDLVREYEVHTRQQRALVARATIVHERLTLLIVSLKRLLADEQFVATARAEGLDTVPELLATRLV